MTEFVLVPGAWLGGWAWKKVVPLLEAKGHSAHPVTLTGMGERVHLASKDAGIETAIQDVLNVIEYDDLDDLVLVGHNFGEGRGRGSRPRAGAGEVGPILGRVPTHEGGQDPAGEFHRLLRSARVRPSPSPRRSSML